MKVRRIPGIYRNVMDNTIQLVFGAPRLSLIWLHGLGETAESFQSFFTHSKSPLYDGMRIKLLQAPLRSVTINDGQVCHSWYDIRSRQRFTRPQEETFNLEHIDQSSNIIDQHVKDQFNWWDQNEPTSQISPQKRIIVGGFSQGGVMALHYGLQNSKIIGGVICKSGYLLKYSQILNLDRLPILLCHGLKDSVIRQFQAKKSFQKLLNYPTLEYNAIESLQHTVSIDSLSLLKNWLRQVNQANQKHNKKANKFDINSI